MPNYGTRVLTHNKALLNMFHSGHTQYTRLSSFKSISIRKENINMVPLFTKIYISDSYKVKKENYILLANTSYL